MGHKSWTYPFAIASNACGTTQLAADTDCQITVTFSPTQAGDATGTLTLTDGAGTQTVLLSGTGAREISEVCTGMACMPAAAEGGGAFFSHPVTVRPKTIQISAKLRFNAVPS